VEAACRPSAACLACCRHLASLSSSTRSALEPQRSELPSPRTQLQVSVLKPPLSLCCRGAGQGPSDAGLTSAQFSLAYERHERVGKISAANAAQKTLVPGARKVVHACMLAEASAAAGGALYSRAEPCCAHAVCITQKKAGHTIGM